jgi:hypothetical protein
MEHASAYHSMLSLSRSADCLREEVTKASNQQPASKKQEARGVCNSERGRSAHVIISSYVVTSKIARVFGRATISHERDHKT